MSRPLSGATTTEVAKAITTCRFLVELGFSVPVRYSSREQVTWNSVVWSAASVRLGMGGGAWTLDLFNDAYLIGQTVLTQGTSGRTARVYQLYGDGPTFAADDAEELLSGEMGEATISATNVRIALKRSAPLRTPRIYLAPPLCNHLPPDGVVIRTASQTVELRRKGTWNRG